MTRSRRGSLNRRGAAIVWVLVVLAVVSVFSAASLARFVACRRQLDIAQNRVQAEWLARSGYELAVGRLLADPDGYTGETTTLIPGGQVKIIVKKDPDKNGVYRVDSEARYTTYPGVVVFTVRRTLKRDDAGKITTLSAEP